MNTNVGSKNERLRSISEKVFYLAPLFIAAIAMIVVVFCIALGFGGFEGIEGLKAFV